MNTVFYFAVLSQIYTKKLEYFHISHIDKNLFP